MGGFIAGPVIKFGIDENSLLASARAAFQKVAGELTASNKALAQQVSAQIANPLTQQAAQLRALFSTGAIGLQALQVQQKALVASLDQEISKLATRNDLTTKELGTLKQLTLERERQANALQRNRGVGVTAGTESALNLVSGPIIANIARLGTGLLGIAGGSGAESSAFTAAAGGIASVTAEGGLAVIALGALGTAFLAAGGAAAAFAISGGKIVENLTNISQRTGISVRDLQVLQAAGGAVDVGLDDLVTGFRKFSQAISGGTGTNEDGSVSGVATKGSQALKILGVTSKDSFTALEQLATAFQSLPDGPTKSAVAIQVLGRSGLQLIPILNKGAQGVEQFRALVEQFGPNIDKNATEAQENWRKSTAELSLEYDRLKVSLSPVLSLIADLTGTVATLIDKTTKSPGAVLSAFGALIGNGTGNGIGSAIATLAAIPDKAAPAFNSLNQMFDVGSAAIKRFGISASDAQKKLDDLLSGKTEALRKLMEEGAKELQALDDESNKSAIGTLSGITKTAQLSGLSESDRVLEEERQKLEIIAGIMLNFPQLASEVGGAVAALTKSTTDQLENLADQALKRRQDENEADEKEKIKAENELNALIKGSDDQLAIDRDHAAQNAVKAILDEEQKRLDETIAKATALGATETQLQALRVSAAADAQAKIVQLQNDEAKKISTGIKAEAGSLFDALLKGGNNFTKTLSQDLEKIALTPVKAIFEQVVSGLLTSPFKSIEDKLKDFGGTLSKKGGVLGSIGTALNPAGSSPISANTLALTGQTTSTDANTSALTTLTGALTGALSSTANGLGVNILGTGGQLLSSTGSGDGIGDLSSFANVGHLPDFGQLSPFDPLDFSQITAGTFPSSTGAASGLSKNATLGLVGGLGTAALGLVNTISGISSHNIPQTIGGIASTAGGGLASIGTALKNPALQGVGTIIGGGGQVISGIAQGGLGGGLQAGIGGAEIGAEFGGPLGAAIGGAAGFVAGLIGGLFHHGISQAEINAAVKKQSLTQAQIDALSGQEFDRAAGSNFTQTSNSTFSEGPGGVFSSHFGPGGVQGTPNAGAGGPAPTPIQFIVNAIDAKGVADFFQRNGEVIAKVVGNHVANTGSGLKNQIFRSLNPA
ncbi:MAG TPA: hypothetical protein VGI16_11365 [Candidatus Acidoferrum sp.]|jgi:hypothetical protein